MKFIQKLGLGFFSLLFFLTFLSLVVPTPTASAQAAGFWLDRSTISSAGKTFFDSDTDSTYHYKMVSDPDGCPDEIDHITDGNTKGELFVKVPNPATSGCDDVDDGQEIALSNSGQSYVFFKWVDSETIMTSDEDDTYVKSATDGIFYESGGDNCKDTLQLGGSNSSATLIVRTGGGNTSFDNDAYREGPNPIELSGAQDVSGGCEEYDPLNVPIGQTTAASNAPGTGTSNTGNTTGNGTPTDEEDNSCESKGGAMGWILCPLITLVDNTLNWVDSQIQSLLEIDENKYTNSQLKQAWSSIRNIAYIILIPIMLVMVIGTAVGIEVFSAYTIKRALPRMVIAVIFITFSWYIVTFFIGFFNVIGAGILGLFTSPFKELVPASCAEGNINLACLYDNGSGPGDVALGLLQNAGTYIGLLVFLLFYGSTLLTMIGIAFLVLLARQLFIVALMLIAPLAILAWIFPGNDKFWKSWWNVFSKLLIMFPLIMAVIAVGRIFALLIHTTADGGGDDTVLNPILKLGAYILPYAFIPFTFRFAGGLFANLAGIANDRSKGIFDRQRAKRAERWNKGKNFGLTSDRNAVGRGINTAFGAVTNPRALMRGRGGVRAARQASRANTGAAAFKEDPIIMANQNDDQFLLALAHRGLAEQKLAQARLDAVDPKKTAEERAAAQASIVGYENALAAASQVKSRNSMATRMAAAQGLAATGYQLSAGEEGYNELKTMMQDITGSDTGAYTNAMNQAQYNLKQAGRFDLAGINNGAFYDAASGVNKASLYQLANSKKESVRAMVTEQVPVTGPWTADQNDKAAVLYKELEAMRPNASGAVAKEIDDQMAMIAGKLPSNYLSQPSGIIDPATGMQRTVQKRVDFDRDRATTTSPRYDAAYAASWASDPDAMTRGWRTEQRPETRGDVAGAKARTYQRPDPNEIP